MNFARFGAALFGLLMLLGHAASAQQELPFIGSWIDRLPDGNAMVTEFSPYTVTFFVVDKFGNTSGPPTTISVDVSKPDEKTYMLTPSGALGEPMAVQVKDANTVYLLFKDRNPRTLRRRVEEEQQDPPHPHGAH